MYFRHFYETHILLTIAKYYAITTLREFAKLPNITQYINIYEKKIRQLSSITILLKKMIHDKSFINSCFVCAAGAKENSGYRDVLSPSSAQTHSAGAVSLRRGSPDVRWIFRFGVIYAALLFCNAVISG
jgi:hypothetical protein